MRAKNTRYYDIVFPMKNEIRIMCTIITVMAVSGCASLGTAVSGGSAGFIELANPVSNLAVGQVVEINSRPRKADITWDPSIPADQITSPEGWTIPAASEKSISSKIAAEIGGILSGNSGQKPADTVSVKLTDIRTRMAPKFTIYKFLQEDLKKNADLDSMIRNYLKTGTKFYVITQITSAKISFSVIAPAGTEISLDAETLRKINSRMNTVFTQSDDKKKYVSGSLMIGFLADSKMLETMTLPK